MLEERPPSVHMAGICKTYHGHVVANSNASLVAYPGEMHAIVGENGAGKSTLVGVLYGTVRPDAGRIRIGEEEAQISGPSDAMRYGIGMVAQHSTLVPALTILDNLMLGHEGAKLGLLNRREEARRYQAVAKSVGIDIALDRRAADVSVAVLQKAQIVRMVARGARVFVLDEPTSALAPHEAENLFAVLTGLKLRGSTILLVTHRLRDVVEHCDRVTVLRSGMTVAERPVSETSAAELSALMIGAAGAALGDAPDSQPSPRSSIGSWWDAPTPHEPVPSRPPAAQRGHALPVLEMRNVSVARHSGSCGLSATNIALAGGEILGVAGVDGSGQRELYGVAVGLERPTTGSVLLCGRDVTRLPLRARMARGLSCIAEDRSREGLVLGLSIAENLLLGSQWARSSGGGLWIRSSVVNGRARRAIDEHAIVSDGPSARAGSLSGGNQQKVLLARALMRQPSVLVAMQPTRGLDARSTNAVYAALREATERGAGVLLCSLDLDEILAVSDRIAVMHGGTIVGILNAADATRDELGRLMTVGGPA